MRLWACLMGLWAGLSPIRAHSVHTRGEPPAQAGMGSSFTVNMPGVKPQGQDSYLCTAFKVSDLPVESHPFYITRFEPSQARGERAHHMLFYGCNKPFGYKPGETWDCRHHTVCQEGSSVMYAWAKNAPPTTLPADVSFAMVDTPYFVLQVHYVNSLEEADNTGLQLYYQTQATKYSAGIYLLLRSNLHIPPNVAKTHGDINCQVASSKPIHLFAYRTHAHKLSTVISGYIYSADSDSYTPIAKGNPQWPQAFYPMDQIHTVKSGEFLVAQCTYDTIGFNQSTRIGATAGDEMCNLYLMYYKEDSHAEYKSCFDVQSTKVAENIPKDSDVPLPPNPLLEEHAKHSHLDEDSITTHRSRGKGDLDNPLEEPSSAQEKGGRRKGDLEAPVVDETLTNVKSVEIHMVGAVPTINDDYMCQAFEIKNVLENKCRIYITQFDANANAQRAHHMILQKCRRPLKREGEIWNCLHHSMCDDQSKIMYAWAKDAPPTALPPDVGFSLDADDGFLVLQVHYKHPLDEKDFTGLTMHYTEDRPSNIAGIYLLYRSYLRIPPQVPVVHGNINCRIPTPMTLFAFRTHTHKLGKVVTGYKFKDGEMKEFARGDPQKPQTFYPMKQFETIESGDYLVARCVFNSMSMNDTVRIGATAQDEMCNLYLMYYSPDENNNFHLCGDEQIRHISTLIPEDTQNQIQGELPISYSNEDNSNYLDVNSSAFVPSKIKKKGGSSDHLRFRRHASYSNNHMQPGQIYPQQPIPVQYSYPSQSQYPLPYPMQQVPQNNPPALAPPSSPIQYGFPVMGPNTNNFGLGQYNGGVGGDGFYSQFLPQAGQPDPNLQQQQPQQQFGPRPVNPQDQTKEPNSVTRPSTEATTRKPRPIASIHGVNEGNRKGKQMEKGLYPVPNWPPKITMDKIGQVSGVSLDIYGNPVVFHRGDRIWNFNTFKSNNVYSGDKDKPIKDDTILTLDGAGNIINSWGSNLFFLPHMLTVDKQNNIWVTDVAMHQVFKFQPYGGPTKKPVIVLGDPFVPGRDDRHYCKPTAVAVSDDGKTFYVADGYCNSRIIKYSLRVDKDGYHNVSIVTQWGQANGAGLSITRSPYAFNIPHGLALASDKNLICVADRENGRIQCFNADSGNFVRSLQPPEMGSTVYSVDYAPVGGGRIYAVCGPEPFGVLTGKVTQGYVIDINSGNVLSTFNGDGKGFQKPHDLAVTPNGSIVYEVELQPFKVWKLTDGKTVIPGNALPTYPAVPGSPFQTDGLNPASKLAKESLEKIGNMIPTSGIGATVALASVVLTCLISLCLACRRCRKRGKGTMTAGAKKKGDGKLDLGDLLGRSKEGFQPLKQDDDDEAANLSSDSDDLEEFSVPALRAYELRYRPQIRRHERRETLFLT
ncbi:hypothetical protein TCAL_12467 [Tigriopus californicus]|uniref:Peptidylglycine monooxygenase n=1 Tax=Tigriopus californicus TaxID=6832 RepID=A0A553NPH6_TIGCA|nr:peptidyl-glycine alpha-amidating monooxygenase B-like [Tigriopus californicus]TRY67348.1 hypothetical protein TCAL_12467 [Tigriopus californicus]